MAELQTLSAVLGIVKNTWHTIEFAQETIKAHKDAAALWERTSDLYVLVESIESTIAGHTEPIEDDIINTIRNALKAISRTLDELAQKCVKLKNWDDLNLVSRCIRPIKFTLSSKSIQKFERELQTNIISAQLALYLLDRGSNKDLARTIESLRSTIETAVQHLNLNATHGPATEPGDGSGNIQGSFDEEQSESSVRALKALSECIDVAKHTATRPGTASSHSSLRQISEGDWTTSSSLRASADEDVAISDQSGQLLGLDDGATCAATAEQTDPDATDKAELMDTITQHFPDSFSKLTGDDPFDLNRRDDQGYTPLMHTAYQHDRSCGECLTIMQKLLKGNADVDICNRGQTALTLAVRSNKAAFVELLLTRGPNVNIVDDADWSLIHHAVWRNSKDALLVLLEAKEATGLNVDVDARCEMDKTPLMYLAENAQCPENLEIARVLLDHDADVNAIDASGCSALSHAIKGSYTSSWRNSFVLLLLEQGADLETVQRHAPRRVKLFPAFKQYNETRRRDSAISA